jgi:hypothetical protein
MPPSSGPNDVHRFALVTRALVRTCASALLLVAAGPGWAAQDQSIGTPGANGSPGIAGDAVAAAPGHWRARAIRRAGIAPAPGTRGLIASFPRYQSVPE